MTGTAQHDRTGEQGALPAAWQRLDAELTRYKAFDAPEESHRQAAQALLRAGAPCFGRKDFPAHFVGNAWLVSPDGARVLLARHRALQCWLPLGGHADGNAGLLNVAMREAQEESGIENLLPLLGAGIMDVDVHAIPARRERDEPAHHHYAVTYMLRALDETFYLQDNGIEALQWFDDNGLAQLDLTPAMERMRKKWRGWRQL